MVIVPLAQGADMATVHGVIYEWGTFEPLENVIVEVNSTPSQSMLARYGLYSFNLAPGNYVISASYYRNNVLVYSTQEEITIKGSGDYVMDIIFLPTFYDPGMGEIEFTELSELADLAEDIETGKSSFSYGTLSMIILTALALVAGAHLLAARRKVNLGREEEFLPADEAPLDVSDEYAALPDDLREMVGIISRNGGRITQKDLRGSLRHSEAKVSLLVSDLEDRGIVRKFKKGRGNVVVLVHSQRDEAERTRSEGPNQNI
ncbi:MAG: hypothetical protein Q8J68_04180 [Methanolobus sp.]|uniref:helix-turn-helix transcriptional regulator n=1 Tax=Methanolobus sp. TaxID=1874737 RepID=UPI00273083C1|nr:hypothetical protein [Methanolobus sp.]MDP2216467.1 hypothetical protein [Methanolobus sp.]